MSERRSQTSSRTSISPLVEEAMASPQMHQAYAEARYHWQQAGSEPTLHAWLDALLKTLEHSYTAEEPAQLSLPAKGPLIIVSNYPYGLVDTLLLAHYASAKRQDLKILAHHHLAKVPEMAPHLIPVNVEHTPAAAKANRAALMEALRHLRSGGALLIFPSGEVASYRPGRGVEESTWSTHLGTLARRSQAAVLPVFFKGRNSLLFHAARLFHRELGRSVLIKDFLKARRKPIIMRVGQPLLWSRLKKFEADDALTRYIRLHTLVLARRQQLTGAQKAASSLEGVSPAAPQAQLAAEVSALREKGAQLVTLGPLSVIYGAAHEIPHLLQEIGRLREITFREVGEGTGQEIDLDRFDAYYLHIFLWDDQEQRLAGAYRLGRADVILKDHGAKGLYTNTLFRFEKPFLLHLQTAVEMGRSFIVKDYQRTPSALPLLWRGVATWVGRHPHYTRLFGPVSISQDYDKLSRKLIVQFLEARRPELAEHVKPRKPFRFHGERKLMREFVSTQLEDVEDCSAVISSVETDGKGLPVLLKHYLRLSGTILSFNVDKDFSDVLDGLVMVDFTETDPKMLQRLMGPELFLEYAGVHNIASAAE
jgi:putative hemolysin